MENGGSSYSKVREITRVANTETEELSREQRQQQNRRVSFRHADDGSLILDCRLPAEAGARFMKALDVAVEEVPKNASAGTSKEPVRCNARRADARALLAESFLAHGAAANSMSESATPFHAGSH